MRKWLAVNHHFGRVGHLVEHWICYPVTYLTVLLYLIAGYATHWRIALDEWHLRHAHGAKEIIDA